MASLFPFCFSFLLFLECFPSHFHPLFLSFFPTSPFRYLQCNPSRFLRPQPLPYRQREGERGSSFSFLFLLCFRAMVQIMTSTCGPSHSISQFLFHSFSFFLSQFFTQKVKTNGISHVHVFFKSWA